MKPAVTPGAQRAGVTLAVTLALGVAASRNAMAQQPAAITATARVVPGITAVTPGTIGSLLAGLRARDAGPRGGSSGGPVLQAPAPGGVSRTVAWEECAGNRPAACTLIIAVDIVGN